MASAAASRRRAKRFDHIPFRDARARVRRAPRAALHPRRRPRVHAVARAPRDGRAAQARSPGARRPDLGRGRREGGRPNERRRRSAVDHLRPICRREDAPWEASFPALTAPRIAPSVAEASPPVNEQLVLPLDEFLSRRRRPASRGRAASSATATCGWRASRGSGSTWTTRWPSTTSRRWTSSRSARRSRSSSRAGYPEFIRDDPVSTPTSPSAACSSTSASATSSRWTATSS